MLIFVLNIGFAQNKRIDSLKDVLSKATHDTSRVLIMSNIVESSRELNIDSAIYYGNKGLALAKQNHFIIGEIYHMSHLGRIQLDLGNTAGCLEIELRALRKAEENHLEVAKILPLGYIGNVYRILNEPKKAINFYTQAMVIAESNKINFASNLKMNIGNTYFESDQLDSAIYYLQTAENEMQKNSGAAHTLVYIGLGNIQTKLKNYKQAMYYYQMSLRDNTPRWVSSTYRNIANLYKELNQKDSSIYYATKSLEMAKDILQRIPTEKDSRFKLVTSHDRAGWEEYITWMMAGL